ncbi:AraC family transcriptional regulator [Actinomadura madurae]|uniref:GlxA family transcriptional regulator n=1 Tax=Actinomadura madurae TaxID=1993 RepID=UPI0020D21C7B|nr:AraC family transcriptional regulator [Actinomadura madurae]MCP9947687.1 AraC family transcriptional regulator [Actinomadura madurae]
MTRIAFLLVPGLHLLDLAGPAQVFSTAAGAGLPYRLAYVADRPRSGDEPDHPPEHAPPEHAPTEHVPTAQGIALQASTAWPALTADDIVLVPGWRWGTGRPHAPPVSGHAARRLAATTPPGGTVASVCAGAFALAHAGLLDGRRCTTHHELQDALARRHPRATVVRDVLYVTDGRVITSAGIASGIDLALHLVAARHGPAAAARIARTMVVYARRNGDEPQASALLRHRAHVSDTVHRAQDLIDARYTRPLPLAALAAEAGVSERTLTRRFAAATGLTPLRYQQELRLERAEHLIGQGATADAAARAVGFTDARMLRRLRARP